jgi:hypothetical protein
MDIIDNFISATCKHPFFLFQEAINFLMNIDFFKITNAKQLHKVVSFKYFLLEYLRFILQRYKHFSLLTASLAKYPLKSGC